MQENEHVIQTLAPKLEILLVCEHQNGLRSSAVFSRQDIRHRLRPQVTIEVSMTQLMPPTLIFPALVTPIAREMSDVEQLSGCERLSSEKILTDTNKRFTEKLFFKDMLICKA